jgi:hypothetical protein
VVLIPGSNASPFITWIFSVLAKAEGEPRDLSKERQILHLTSRHQETTREETKRKAINRDCKKYLMSQKDIAMLAEAVQASQGMVLGCRIMRERMSQKGWPYTEEERHDKGGKSP